MTLDLTADQAVFTADFGETVDFRANSSATAREDLAANVNRTQVEEDNAQPYSGNRLPLMHVMLANNATTGITAAEVVPDKSEIKVGFPEGATPRWRRVTKVLRANPGCVLLEVRQ